MKLIVAVLILALVVYSSSTLAERWAAEQSDQSVKCVVCVGYCRYLMPIWSSPEKALKCIERCEKPCTEIIPIKRTLSDAIQYSPEEKKKFAENKVKCGACYNTCNNKFKNVWQRADCDDACNAKDFCIDIPMGPESDSFVEEEPWWKPCKKCINKCKRDKDPSKQLKCVEACTAICTQIIPRSLQD
jgi:hypothetical protein